MKTNLLIFRHQVVENPDNIFYGVSRDLPISDTGKEAARKSGASLAKAGIRPIIIYASPLLRAQMTAAELAEGMRKDITLATENGLIDVSYPHFEGRSVDKKGQIVLDDGRIVSLNQMDEFSAETPIEVGERFVKTIKEISQRHPGETIGIVSHADPIAWGLELLRAEKEADFAMKGLMGRGTYPAKGDLAVARLNPDGSLYGKIHFRPEIAEVPMLLELIRTGKERI
jgi:broad specificity phosphatase PhoE